jgi:tRNA (guanine-N7-)-methyltransferase
MPAHGNTHESRIEVAPEELIELRWERLFGNTNPVELEIGAGKGGFLLRRAQAFPDRNFLGIEWASEFYKYATDRMRRWRVTNVRMLRTDAGHFISSICPRDSLSALHVYHPDPWPKRRHWKRRLFQPRFVEAAIACLRSGARWWVQTDHAEYFEVMRALLGGRAEIVEVSFDDPALGINSEDIASNFEIKYRRQGREIHRIAVQKL